MRTLRCLIVLSAMISWSCAAWAQQPTTPATADRPTVIGLWKVTGTDAAKGRYTGDVDLVAGAAAGAITASGTARYGDGSESSWSGAGTVAGNTVKLEYLVAGSGAAERLDLAHPPAGAKRVKGEFRLTPSGKTLSGKFWSDDDRRLGGAAEMTRRVTKIARVWPEQLGAPLLDPMTVTIYGRDLPPKSALALTDISFGDANIAVEEIVSVNAARSQIKVKIRLRHGTATGKKDVTVKGVTGERLLDILVAKNVFVGLGDGNTDGVPWDEYLGDWGIRSLMKDFKATALAPGRDGPWYFIRRDKTYWYVKLALNKQAFAEGMAFEGAIGAFDGHAHSGSGPSWPPVETTEYYMGTGGADIHAPGAAKFSALFYNGCWSMRYFGEVLLEVNPPAVFFGCNDMSNASQTTGNFIKMMVQGKPHDEIVRKLNTYEGAGDISVRPGR